jgi:hypothetical protein
VFNYGMMPLGALLGGLLAAPFGIRTAMWATTGLLPLSAAFIMLSPLRRLRTLPTGPQAVTTSCATRPAVATSSSITTVSNLRRSRHTTPGARGRRTS